MLLLRKAVPRLPAQPRALAVAGGFHRRIDNKRDNALRYRSNGTMANSFRCTFVICKQERGVGAQATVCRNNPPLLRLLLRRRLFHNYPNQGKNTIPI
jgi:hypothetical protein